MKTSDGTEFPYHQDPMIVVASTGDLKLWAFYLTVVAGGAKILAFAVQYVVLRLIVTSRRRAAARA